MTDRILLTVDIDEKVLFECLIGPKDSPNNAMNMFSIASSVLRSKICEQVALGNTFRKCRITLKNLDDA